jgi:type VI protein secretion system component VasF
MNQQTASTNPDQRRGIRRTVWIMAAVALTMFVLFFVQQAFWR